MLFPRSLSIRPPRIHGGRPFPIFIPAVISIVFTLAACTATTTTTTSGSNTSLEASSNAVSDDPRVSRSRGTGNGVVVLWPRIVPQEATGNSADLAGAVQNHVRRLAEQALPGYTIDVRPSPERTCPEAGCLGVSVAVLFMREENGCALAAVVSGPGRTSGRLIPWVGELTLESTTVAFRDPPENHVLVRDFMPCGDLLGHLNDGDARIVEAIKEAAR